MKNIFRNKVFFALTALAITFTSCDKDDPEIPNEEEVITTLSYVLTDVSNAKTYQFLFKDLDGDGGIAPVLTSDTLPANANFTGTITLLNEQKNPAEDITDEVKGEKLEHQFFFRTTLTTASSAYADTDVNGNPVGISTTFKTGNSGIGTLTITLKHEPSKSAAGVKDGDITNAGGETDIEVTFPLLVK